MGKLKQILAITAIVIIVALFITTLVLAVLDSSSALFQASLYATVLVPAMLYIFLWLYKLIHGENKAK